MKCEKNLLFNVTFGCTFACHHYKVATFSANTEAALYYPITVVARIAGNVSYSEKPMAECTLTALTFVIADNGSYGTIRLHLHKEIRVTAQNFIQHVTNQYLFRNSLGVLDFIQNVHIKRKNSHWNVASKNDNSHGFVTVYKPKILHC